MEGRSPGRVRPAGRTGGGRARDIADVGQGRGIPGTDAKAGAGSERPHWEGLVSSCNTASATGAGDGREGQGGTISGSRYASVSVALAGSHTSEPL